MSAHAVAKLRTRLWEAGFRPVPIYNHDAAVEGAGKRPRGNHWQDRARRHPPAAVIERPELIALNTGILCDGLRAVDLDIDDPALAATLRELVERLFGSTIIRTRCNRARALILYRATEGAPGKRILAGQLGKVEVLGLGQQFVAYGRHPSGAELLWLCGGPAERRRDDLPAISESRITAFLDAAAALIKTTPRPRASANSCRFQPNSRALAGLLRRIASAPEGDRNSLAFWGACRAGEMVAAGLLGAETAVAVIAEAATRAGLSHAEATRTAASGVRAGRGASNA